MNQLMGRVRFERQRAPARIAARVCTRRGRLGALSSSTKLARVSPVAARTLAIVSVLGQWGFPAGLVRLLLLKAVGSSPAWRASPETDIPCLAANKSMARHRSECVRLLAIAKSSGQSHQWHTENTLSRSLCPVCGIFPLPPASLVAPARAMPTAVGPPQPGCNQGIAQVATIRQPHIGINPLPVLVWLDS
jgi:hypothetical protein